MASSTSSWPASATWPSTASVAGFTSSTSFPSMSIRCSPDAVPVPLVFTVIDSPPSSAAVGPLRGAAGVLSPHAIPPPPPPTQSNGGLDGGSPDSSAPDDPAPDEGGSHQVMVELVTSLAQGHGEQAEVGAGPHRHSTPRTPGILER